MRLGLNWSYDGSTDQTREVFGRLNSDSVVIMSHAADYPWIIGEFPRIEFMVRCKTGPGHLGTYPADILDYREWDTEQSLREALTILNDQGRTPRVILGNEPDTEMTVEPVDDPGNRRNAIDNYIEWYMDESAKIRRAFPGVQISPAPLSQGNRDRWLAWAIDMHKVFRDADFIAVHCYTPEGTGFDDPDWGGQWRWYRAAYANKPICITETDLNGDGPAERIRDYVSHVAATGEVEEIDIFSLPGGAQDESKPSWWWISSAMADIIAAADRNPAPIVEPTEPAPEEPVTMTRDQARRRALADIWTAEPGKADYAPDTAIGAYWEANYTDLGSPCGPERHADDGSVWQGFGMALVCATPGDPWVIEVVA